MEKDVSAAAGWYRKAARQGSRVAACSLGYLYETGEGVNQSWEEAVKLYRQAADQGSAQAQFNLAQCYENGTGVRKNPEKAAELYRLAADQDFEEAKEALDRLKNGAPAPAKGSAAKPSALPKEGARKDPPKGGFLKGLFGGRKDR